MLTKEARDMINRGEYRYVGEYSSNWQQVLDWEKLNQRQQYQLIKFILSELGVGRSQLGVLYTRFKKRCLSGDEPACR